MLVSNWFVVLFSHLANEGSQLSSESTPETMNHELEGQRLLQKVFRLLHFLQMLLL